MVLAVQNPSVFKFEQGGSQPDVGMLPREIQYRI